MLEVLSESEPTGYTSVLKILQIMSKKGLVEADARKRSYVYRPLITQKIGLGKMVGDLVDRVFDGSTQQLLLHALEQKKASREEIEDIRRMLEEFES